MTKVQYRDRLFSFQDSIGGNVIRTLQKGRFYEGTMLEFIENLYPENTVIDVGANIGNHTIYLVAFTDCEKVIALEPHPRMWEVLDDNVKQNQLSSKVETKNMAAGEENGNCDIQEAPENRLGNTQVVANNQGTVPMKTLDSIAGKRKVSIIKIDVEGFEPQVLKGSMNILNQQSPDIFIEARNKKEKREIDRILQPLGYEAIKVFNRTPTYYYTKKAYNFSGRQKLRNKIVLNLGRFRLFRSI